MLFIVNSGAALALYTHLFSSHTLEIRWKGKTFRTMGFIIYIYIFRQCGQYGSESIVAFTPKMGHDMR